VQFQRLRLTGFKSFVEPTELRIEPGLTAVVGPNGCGKSNLLEALRWVMGANSAKAMRAEGMDDVIFAGADGRPGRNRAEVLLQIDNSDRTAPARFNEHATLEVIRRIDRGAGSTYRINGQEVRARDVQLLFADASTGANSPALVRQGQISELIGAKPSNRRRILEEAAGVSGLHTRRHEADLRLKAAEANLERLEDVAAELEAAHGRLRREARQAEKYKRLSAEIRTLQGAALLARFRDAESAAEAALAAEAEAEALVAETAREVARLTVEAAHAAEAVKPLREEELVAAAVLQRLAIDRDRLEREAAQATAEVDRLKGELARIAEDRAREVQAREDAVEALARLGRELREVESAIAAAPERGPELQRALEAAGRQRAAADAEVERLASEAAAEAAHRQARRARLEEVETLARAAARRAEEAGQRLDRTRRALATAEADRAQAALPAAEPAAARAALDAAVAELARVRALVETAEADRARALVAENEARDAARTTDDALRRLKSEAAGLDTLLDGGKVTSFPRALDSVRPDPGYEAAVAAALGEDLDAALDTRAPAYWGGAEARAPVWPQGASPLADHVRAPPALAARLAMVALVEAEPDAVTIAALPTGARLVSRGGDLWRWDGLVVRAAAPRPAAKRMAQKARRESLAGEIAAAEPEAARLTEAHRAAQSAVRATEEALRTARRAPEAAERALAHARDTAERHAREEARREARLQSLTETCARFIQEVEEAQAGLTTAEAERGAAAALLDVTRREAGDDNAPAPDTGLAAARARAGEAREAEARARAALDTESRAREGRLRRQSGLTRDVADWTKRQATADARLQALDRDSARTHQQLAAAQVAPQTLGERSQTLLGEVSIAETRRKAAADALSAAETLSGETDRANRAAETAASQARERRAGEAVRLEAARERLIGALDAVRQATRLEPAALARALDEAAVAIPTNVEGVDTHLAALERERDQLGAVNLRAEEEVGEHAQRLETMRGERADLTDAIARLRGGIEELNAEGRERLMAAFDKINTSFKTLFQTLFEGGEAELRLVESDDPLEAGLEIFACPPGKRMAVMSLMSGGEQALTATALIFAVFLANPAPICVLDEVDAPLDDANVDRFCKMLHQMRELTQTRFIAITHNPVTMSRMDRLYGVTMAERGVSQLVSVDLKQAEALAAE
jgi:chromosome segregation protein